MQEAAALTPDTEDGQGQRHPLEVLKGYIASNNICDDIEETKLAGIGTRIVSEYQIDLTSRESWEEGIKAAMDLAMQVKEEKNYPWPNAANIKFPLLTTAAIQFAARAYPAIVDGRNVVRGKVIGADPDGTKQARADRVGRHMSYQLLDEMEEWEEDTDRMLHMLPIIGCVFKKTYYDPLLGRNCSVLINPKDFVVNYWTKSLLSCPRMTHVCSYYPHEIEEKMRSGMWRTIEYGSSDKDQSDDNAPHEFLEQHCRLDLDDDGYAEPYIVMVHRATQRVVRIVARFDQDGVLADKSGRVTEIKAVPYFVKYSFIPAPDGSFYDIGFGVLLNALNETINSTINQLMDAGHLQNTNGGFLGNGVNIKGGKLTFGVGEWKRVDVTAGTLRDNIVPLEAHGPSPVLFQLLGMLIEAARDITATKDILTGETQSANTPVGTTLALIEQGLKVFTAIYKRIHRGIKKELAMLYRLNRIYMNDRAYANLQDTPEAVGREDYDDKSIDVIPVSDPTVVSDMQRLGRAQYLMQFASDPMMNGEEIRRRALEAASIPDVDKLINKNPPPDPKTLIEGAKMEIEKSRLANDTARLEIARLTAAAAAATARAAIAESYANSLAVLAGIGVTADGVRENMPPEALQALDSLRQIAEQEMEDEEADGRGMEQLENPSHNGDVPPVPQGQAVPAGPEMGGGQPNDAPAPDGSQPDGQPVGPGL